MRRFLQAAALIGVGTAIGLSVVVANAGASSAPPSTRTMLNVAGDPNGQPLPVRVAGSGFSPGALVYIEQCDGTAPTAVGWSPTANCDLGTSNAPVLADATGLAVFQPDDANHAFTPFKGQSPQALFNCLSPNQATLSGVDSLPDFRNCQVRLSTSNTTATSDQQFLDLTLPDAVWEAPFAHPGGSCTGQRILGKWAPAESNTPANEVLATAVLKDTSTHATLGGSCSATGIGTLTPKAFALKVGGSTSCSATSSSAPTVGKLTIVMNEINPATGSNYKIQAYVRRTPGVDPTAPDISLYQGTISDKSLGAGNSIVGTLFEDPVVKAPKGVVSQTGYVDDHSTLTLCKAGSATITTVEMGSGVSKFGGIATGLHFGY